MKGMTMRLALLAAAIVVGTLGLNTPLLLVKDSPEEVVTPAEASIPTQALQPRPLRIGATRIGSSELIGGLGAVGSVTPRQAVHATGHVIPADLPQPPIGHFKLTAYSGPQLGQPLPITATGTAARAGRTVAVDPSVIPLGSRIYIEGIGERIAEDVGGGIKGHHIDVYLGTVPQARDFGVRRGSVSMVAPPKQTKRDASDDRS
jgi:3D (Asp-Asp-Asp) domain-containing protein